MEVKAATFHDVLGKTIHTVAIGDGYLPEFSSRGSTLDWSASALQVLVRHYAPEPNPRRAFNVSSSDIKRLSAIEIEGADSMSLEDTLDHIRQQPEGDFKSSIAGLFPDVLDGTPIGAGRPLRRVLANCSQQ